MIISVTGWQNIHLHSNTYCTYSHSQPKHISNNKQVSLFIRQIKYMLVTHLQSLLPWLHVAFLLSKDYLLLYHVVNSVIKTDLSAKDNLSKPLHFHGGQFSLLQDCISNWTFKNKEWAFFHFLFTLILPQCSLQDRESIGKMEKLSW